jgi:putative FmdB family regulatory protein
VPIYDYVCQSCGTRTEVIHGVHLAGPEICERCGGRLRRAVSVPAIHFKGSGWAKMDARSGARKGQTDDKSAADTTTTTDAAPAAKKDSAGGESSTGGESSAGADSAADKKTASDAKGSAAG